MLCNKVIYNGLYVDLSLHITHLCFFIYAAIVGMTINLGHMWSIAETFNGLMTILNLIAVFLLSVVVIKLVKEYFNG